MENNLEEEIVSRIVDYLVDYAEKSENPFLDIDEAIENLVPISFNGKNDFIDKIENSCKSKGYDDKESRKQAVYSNCGGTVGINIMGKEIALCLDETNPSLYHLIEPISHEIYHGLITPYNNLYQSVVHDKKDENIKRSIISIFGWKILDEGLGEWVCEKVKEKFEEENDCEKYKTPHPQAFESIDEKYKLYVDEYFKKFEEEVQFKNIENLKIETYTSGLDICKKIEEKFGEDTVPFAITSILNHYSLYNSVDDEIVNEYSKIHGSQERELYRMKKRFDTNPVKVALKLAEMPVPEDYKRNDTNQLKEIIDSIISEI